MSFSDDIDRFTDKVEEKALKVMRLSFLELSNQIISSTPVDTGRLRANWQSGVNNKPSSSVISTSAETSYISARVESNRLKVGDGIYLINNLAYAKAIEDGHSQAQAPRGMVKVAVAGWDSIVNAATRKVK